MNPRTAWWMVAASTLALACAPQIDEAEFAPWTLAPQPETPVVSYRWLPLEEREEEIELVRDLVIGSEEREELGFYRVAGIAADDDGRVFVLDAGARAVRAFDSTGRYLFSFGEGGQGPGEFQQPTSIVMSGDRLVVCDSRNMRLSSWSRDGQLLDDVSIADPLQIPILLGASTGIHGAKGTLVGLHMNFVDGIQHNSVSELSVAGAIIEDLIVIPLLKPSRVPRAGMFRVISLPRPVPSYAASASGRVYVTDAKEYQVLAFDNGAEAWALRVNVQRGEFTEPIVNSLLAEAREKRPETRRDEIGWPTHLPALSRIRVDGRGRLFVYPFAQVSNVADRRPVDVYSPEGELLFAGTIPNVNWMAANATHVFDLGVDEASGEYRVRRYRLRTSF